MQRGGGGTDTGGLGTQLVGDKISVNGRSVTVTRMLGEGGFSYVYQVKDNDVDGIHPNAQGAVDSKGSSSSSTVNVLKVTSIHSRQQREIAEKEAKLLSRLSHPSIIKMHDACYRIAPPAQPSGGIVAGVLKKEKDGAGADKKEHAQHMILMEYAEGGHALDVCNNLKVQGKRFDLPSLIIAFGQICNAVSYLHAQRPPIVHRDLKPVNFLVKNGAYKLCDFGSAAFGHVELKTPAARAEAEESIQRTTTQMFRAPEMVDLYMTKKLTQSTDVWALGCCLYSLAFLQNCFEEGSNLAILSRNYKIPENHPYGEGIVELIDRMLTVDCKARADMTEVILCLSAIYSGRPLPPRKSKASKTKRSETEGTTEAVEQPPRSERVGTYRTDGQGITSRDQRVVEPRKPAEAKKLNPNSAAARRRRAAGTGTSSPHEQKNSKVSAEPEFADSFSTWNDGTGSAPSPPREDVNQDLAFSMTRNPFASAKIVEADEKKGDSDDAMFGKSKSNTGGKDFVPFNGNKFWDKGNANDELSSGIENINLAQSRDRQRQRTNSRRKEDPSGEKSGAEVRRPYPVR
mmetsp:Transcript_12569/g.19467  ORF Transcript_12569/g.19467 Transcript_12569/m.19467 type:complete len:572 (-) Transcript_12569:123-1838(-)|eukprot:CAMPEP_0195282204 /NCGR_PEP_ID=MMETSP0707-20130614/1180_1 /TAXON_ID=33640 /ORGANISM="Asterionellopsis glacialis, Strain CCMP134" /LENGTH=571 /DNA_ID=CAMNT_0040341157 /DNA_START=349 /DNA_END=2064 /DNA_ORIENTATION=-